MSRPDLWEFLRDGKVLSAGRLAYIGSFVAATVFMGWLTYADDMTEGYFGIYTGTFALGYVGGKAAGRGQNDITRNKRI
jgi:hypothetical protein